MKPFENFLADSVGLRRLTELYLELRQYLQELGWSEKDLENPPFYNDRLIGGFQNLHNEQKSLFRQVKDLGFKLEEGEFNDYIDSIIEKINEITPLSNGDYKRGNQGDEDY